MACIVEADHVTFLYQLACGPSPKSYGVRTGIGTG